MTEPVTVAVVVPTHNRRDLVVKTLDSLKTQSRPPDRVIVVADGCTDGTVEALAARGDVTVVSSPGVGAAGARNAGWRLSDAGIIAFIDDDCWAEPEWLAGFVKAFADPAVGVVQGKTLPSGPVGPYDRTVNVVGQTGLYESCNIAYRRDVLEAVGGMREDFGRSFGPRGGDAATGGGSGFGEDTDLAWRALRLGWRPAFADQAVVRHAVFAGTPRSVLAETWRTRFFPYLLREIPELRGYLPGGRWFFRKHSAMAQAATGGVAGGLVAAILGRRPLPIVLAVPYLVWLARQTRRPERAAMIVARDAVMSAALVAGSIRHRTLVL